MFDAAMLGLIGSPLAVSAVYLPLRALRHRRPRNRRLNRRLTSLQRQPLPAPWDGAIVNNWGRAGRADAESRGMRL